MQFLFLHNNNNNNNNKVLHTASNPTPLINNNNNNNNCIYPHPASSSLILTASEIRKPKQLACCVAGIEWSEGTDTSCSWTGG
jgi:hypothetical protein